MPVLGTKVKQEQRNMVIFEHTDMNNHIKWRALDETFSSINGCWKVYH